MIDRPDRQSTGTGGDRDATGGRPWIKLVLVVVAVLALLIAVVLLAGDDLGGHGPGQHVSSGFPLAGADAVDGLRWPW